MFLLVLVAFSLLRRDDNCCISHDDSCMGGVSLSSPPHPPSITLEHIVERSSPPLELS